MAPLSLRLAVANDLKHKRPTPRCGDGVRELARRHPSRQLAAVCRRELLTITPTTPTPVPLRVFFFLCQVGPVSTNVNRFSSLLKEKWEKIQLFSSWKPIFTHLHKLSWRHLYTHTHTHTQALVMAQSSSRSLRAWELSDCNRSLLSTGTGPRVISGCQGKSPPRPSGSEDLSGPLTPNMHQKRNRMVLPGGRSHSSGNIIHTVCLKHTWQMCRAKERKHFLSLGVSSHTAAPVRRSEDALVRSLSL